QDQEEARPAAVVAAHAPAAPAPTRADAPATAQSAAQRAAAPAQPARANAAAGATGSAEIDKSLDDARLALDAINAQRAELQREIDELAAARLDAEHALAR